MILALVPALASAGTVRVTVAWGPGGPELVRAVRSEGHVGSVPPGALEWVDADGRVLGTAAIPDPRIRSVITPEGGESAVLASSVARLVVPWPDGAVGLRLGGRSVIPSSSAPPLAVPVHEGGPAAERLDLVILGDGYTRARQERFADDVQALTDYLLALEPYDRYADLLNVWRVDTASADRGISRPGAPRDTAFGCAYGCGGIDRLVCCDDERVLGAVERAVPEADGILVLLDDPEYGGSGGFTYATSYNGPEGLQVAAHELAHSLVGLWDEYSYGVSGTGEGPNCARDPAGSWDPWLPDVGSFRECTYVDLYRPTEDGCMMRTLQDGYCPVCRERVVLAMHEALPGLIRTTDPEPGPATDRIVVETTTDPSRLTFDWQLDGQPVSADPTLELACADLHGELTLRVTDDTPWVRRDPNRVLVDEAGPWTVDAPACEPEPEPDPEPDPPGDDDDEDPAPPPSKAASCGCGTAPSGGWLPLALLLVRRRRWSS